MRSLMFLVLGLAMVGCGDTDRDKTVFMPSTARAVFAPDNDPITTPTDPIPGSGNTIGTDLPTSNTPEQNVEYVEIWGNSTFFVCRSDVMSTGKYLRAIVEENPEGMRHFTVNLMLDDRRMQIFDGYQQPADSHVNGRILVSIDETIKASYGLGYDALYEMNFDTKQLTIGVTSGRVDHASTALGVPPASCTVMQKAQLTSY